MKTSGVTKENYKLEKKYDLWDIIITPEEAQKISTVKEAAEYISNKIAKKEEL